MVVRNFGVLTDGQQSFIDCTAAISFSCCFVLYNIQKTRPYLTQHAKQILLQAMVIPHLEYWNVLFSFMAPIKMIQNESACLFVMKPKAILPVSTCIKFKSFMFSCSVFWLCFHLLDFHLNGQSITVFLPGTPPVITIPTHKAIPVQVVCAGGSLVVK